MSYKKRPTIEYLKTEYLEKGKSIRTIAEENSVVMATVQRWLVCYDIPRRSKSDYKTKLETRLKISKAKKKSGSWLGDKNPNWAGGISRDKHGERSTGSLKSWRQMVKAKDDWICQNCGLNGKVTCSHCKIKPRMHADHIKPWKDYPNLRFKVSNGRTLCEDCHIRKTG